MVMEDNEQPPAPIAEASAPEVVDRPLWVLSRDEQRVLIITFVGGVASVVAGVCVVGGAIAVLRFLRAQGDFSLWILVVATAVQISSMLVAARARRHGLWSRTDSIWFLILCGGLGLLLLVWTGVAADIH